MDELNKLTEIADKLESYSKILDEEAYSKKLDVLEKSVEEIGKSFSGSWLGYHSKVYYRNFVQPPAGARFSQEWGLMDDSFVNETRGSWVEYNYDDVIEIIEEGAGEPDTTEIEEKAFYVSEKFKDLKDKAEFYIAQLSCEDNTDNYLSDLIKKIKDEKIIDGSKFIKYWAPSGQLMSRDMVALEKGLVTPPHYSLLGKIYGLKQPFLTSKSLAKMLNLLASYLKNKLRKEIRDKRIGTNIFIGHGRSFAWRDLKDFIQDRMRLPWDEFNRVPVAGVTNIARLSQMLDEAAFAFLILTAEDEQEDGRLRARQNAVHEAGLFQGRLGFEKAILLIEEECEEFSNIEGLGQIRFPKGNISAVFEEIRRVLERESLIEH